ncbi:hypothetical protein Tco_1401949 [Tanacetum coccineum]
MKIWHGGVLVVAGVVVSYTVPWNASSDFSSSSAPEKLCRAQSLGVNDGRVEGIRCIGNWSNAFSCEVLALIRRISFVGYGVEKPICLRTSKSHEFLALGWLLEEIHVTWAHLEKKQTRLRTYTKSHDDFCKQWLETASQA